MTLDPSMKLQGVAASVSAAIPEGVDSLVVLSSGGASNVALSSGAEDLSGQAPEIIGIILKKVCDAYGIGRDDAIRRIQSVVWSVDCRSLTKATKMVHLRGGPLDGHVVELLDLQTMIRVPYRHAACGPVAYAEYGREESGDVYRYNLI